MSNSNPFHSRFLVVALLVLFSQLSKVTSVDEFEPPSHLRGSMKQQLGDLLQNDTPAEDPTNFWNTFDDATLNDGPWIVTLPDGQNSAFIAAAEVKANDNSNRKKPFKVKYNFGKGNNDNGNNNDKKKNIKKMNGVALDGISFSDLTTLSTEFPEAHILPDSVKQVHQKIYSWGVDRIDQHFLPLTNTYTPIATAGCGVDVYILDTGLDTTHTEFKASRQSTRVVQNLFNAFATTIGSNTDGNGHGTHVAGVLGGNNIGVAPCSNLYGMKVLSDGGTGYVSDILAALTIVEDRHVTGSGSKSIVNLSLGGPCVYTDPVQCATEDVLITEIEYLSSLGIVFAISAGNDNQPASIYSPAAAPNAVTVAASTKLDVRAIYSNYGSSVDIYAPGTAIYSACSKLVSGCTKNNNIYTFRTGTSLSAPHVAGVLATFMPQISAYYQFSNWDTLEKLTFLRDSLLCASTRDIIAFDNADDVVNNSDLANTVKHLVFQTNSLLSSLPSCFPIVPPFQTTADPSFAPTASPTTVDNAATEFPTIAPTLDTFLSVLPSLAPTAGPSSKQRTPRPTRK